jgi:ATP-dependent Clp protease protease subunit
MSFYVDRIVTPANIRKFMSLSKSDLMLQRRCIVIQGVIEDAAATDCIAQLLYLAMESPVLPVTLHIDSPGGSLTASFAIVDTLGFIKCPVATWCFGSAGGTAAMIVAHGKPGFRTTVPTGIFGFSPTTSPQQGADISKIHTRFVRELMRGTGRSESEITALFHESIELDAIAAAKFGLVDSIAENPVTPRVV